MAFSFSRLMALLTGAVVLGLVVLAVFLIVGARDMLPNTIEKLGKLAFKSDVSIAETIAAYGDGTFLFNGIQVRNPAGFGDDSAINIPQVRVLLSKAPTQPNSIMIERIDVIRPDIRLYARNEQSNLVRLQVALEGSLRRESEGSEDERTALTFSTERIHVEGGTLTLISGDREPLETSLPIVRRNVSHEVGRALTEVQLTKLVYETILQSSKRGLQRKQRNPDFSEFGLSPEALIPPLENAN